MPQMSPMFWTNILLFAFMIFYMILILLSTMPIKLIYKNYNFKKNKMNKNWKWLW